MKDYSDSNNFHGERSEESSWKDSSCEHCAYRVDFLCRRLPRFESVRKTPKPPWHKEFSVTKIYTEACAEFKDVAYE